ncbi:hypothetical protein O3M35_010257 [Rhynocoris fuscipes]|uniref:Uncharacterized protein n=1 Tax=Rhynocoris fuscipes TaxID=488301 RepID=A0AAW1CY79_9HEMI
MVRRRISKMVSDEDENTNLEPIRDEESQIHEDKKLLFARTIRLNLMGVCNDRACSGPGTHRPLLARTSP